jgi:hypothetical protein
MSTTQRVANSASAHSGPDFFELMTRQGVRDPEEVSLRRRVAITLVSFAVLFGGHIWVSMQRVNLGYRNEALGRAIDRLDQERSELEDALARESRPPLLASRAVELGMQKPAHGQLRRLDAKP